jgi:hypothetical protein
MNKGDWVNVKFTEQEGKKTVKCSYTGEVVEVAKQQITIASNEVPFGFMTFPLDDADHMITITTKQKLNMKVPVPVVEKVVKSSKSGSKREKAIELYNTASDQSKDSIVNLFMIELDMTPAGAQTYYYMAKKGA